ncbi:heparin lyase I family protein [Streptomyces sp. SP18CS02]|uniref:heparin lyase I family protein n=1 Tax=Streptomyces sp. SP18CS02 TaxID=3002531 RepID=UPI002E791B6D|nr:heparin lyase I family protein [Streptomyces sp. SP18CS02]MEE1752714.1 heparin lyase I family protein [Streptomyces sp. SP18CS02]
MPIANPLPSVGRPARLLISCTTALLVLGVGAASPAAAADSVSYDFESSSQKLPYMALKGAGRILVGPAPGGKSGQAARVNLPNDGSSFKSELVIKGLDAGSHRFSFANYLPGDWQKQDFDTIVTQWFSTQDDDPRIKPVLALSIHGGDWRLKVHWMSGGQVQEKIIPLGTARLGHWNQWTFDITWSSPNTPGSITVTRDGATVGSHQGANNYHRGQPPHFRIGAYRPGWRPEKGPRLRAGASEAVLFIDDIAITSTAAGAAPAPRPTATGSAASPPRPSAPSPGSTSTSSPSAPVSTKAGAAPTSDAPAAAAADDTGPGTTDHKTETDGSSLPSTGATGVIGIAAASAAALAGGFLLLRRRNATGSPRRAHRR